MTILKKIIAIIKFLIPKTFRIKYYEYHYFAIDYLKPLDLNHIEEFFAIYNVLEDQINSLRVSDGTLLGFIRGGDIIPHDNDYDFDLIYSGDSLKKIRSIFDKKNFKLGRLVVVRSKVQQITYYSDLGNIYDFIFWHKNKSHYVNYSEPGYLRFMPLNFLDDLIPYYLNKYHKFVRIPRKKVDWLIFRYGDNWNIPKYQKDDWKETCGDLISIND